MAAAALFLDHRFGNGREIVAATGLCPAENKRREGNSEQAEGQRAGGYLHVRLLECWVAHWLIMKVSQSPFSSGVHSRPSTSLQLRLNHFSTFAESV